MIRRNRGTGRVGSDQRRVGRAMSKFVLTRAGSQLGRSLKNGTRDFASDWKHWSWGERIIAVLAALSLLSVPALVGGSL